MEVMKDKRLEVENEFLALLIKHNQLINITQIKPEWLSDRRAKKMLTYALECYKSFNCFNITEVVKLHNDFDFEYYVELLDDTITYSSSIYDHLRAFEETIVKYYKEDVIRKYNEKLMRKTINYDQFIEVVEKLNDIELV